MKKPDVLLREYVTRLSDEELDYLYLRFSQRIAGDISEALTLVQKNHEVDRWLCSANSAVEFFDMVDKLAEFVEIETKRRASPKKEPKKQQPVKAAS